MLYLEHQHKQEFEQERLQDKTQWLLNWTLNPDMDFEPESTPALQAAIRAFKTQLKKGKRMKFDQEVQSGGGSNDFLKLKDQETATGVFRGEVYHFRTHWLGSKSDPCTGQGCSHCASGNKPKFRFRLNFVTNDFNVKIFEGGPQIYNMLKELHSSDYNLERSWVKIKRNGTGTDTNYLILPIPNGIVQDKHEQKLVTLKLHDLSLSKQTASAQVNEPAFDDIPF